MSNFRSIWFSDTDGPPSSDGILYIDIPDRREYIFYTGHILFQPASTTGLCRPTIELVTSSNIHGSSGGEVTVAKYFAPIDLADSGDQYCVLGTHLPWNTDAEIFTDYQYIPLPELVVSTSFRTKIYLTDTGRADHIEFSGIVGIRDEKGHRV
jgi:hypothetical protein